MIEYSNSSENLTNLDLSGFFVGWPNPPQIETLRKILTNSQHIYLAIEKNKLIGFVNALSDGVLSAYIPLLEVLPQYQGRGIGQALVEKIKSDLSHYYMIDICCDDDVVSFYEKLKFTRGNSMILRNYANQAGHIL
jgi:ribosomal protein S18 acetylase RimI-like enzyme